MSDRPGILLSTLDFRGIEFGELQFTSDRSSLLMVSDSNEIIRRKVFVDDKLYVKKVGEQAPQSLADEYVEYADSPQQETEERFVYKNQDGDTIERVRYQGYTSLYLRNNFERRLPDLNDCVLRDGSSLLYDYSNDPYYNPPEDLFDVVPKRYIDDNLPEDINGTFIKTDGSVPMAPTYSPVNSGHLITKEFAELGNMKIVLPNYDPGYKGALWNSDQTIAVSQGPVFHVRYYVDEPSVIYDSQGFRYYSNQNLEINFRSNSAELPIHGDVHNIISIEIVTWGSRSSIYRLAYNFQKLRFVYISESGGDKVTNMKQMFYACYGLERVERIDSRNVLDISYAFYGCSSLKCLGGINTESATSKGYMFNGDYLPEMKPNQEYRDKLMSTSGYNYATTCN